MIVNKKTEGTTLILELKGNLDATVEEAVRTYIEENIGNMENLIFDLAEVPYISSAGIRVVVTAVKLLAKKGSVKLINVNEEVQEVFDLVGLKDILDVE